MPNTNDIFVGIDYSYTSPGITIFHDGKYFCYALWHNKVMPNKSNDFNVHNQFFIHLDFYDQEIKYQTEFERYIKLSEWSIKNIKSHIKPYQHVYIAIEGYSMGSHAGMIFNIAENTAILKKSILDNISPNLKLFIAYPPTFIKKESTGKGNSKKPELAKAFFSKNKFYIHEILKKSNPDSNPASDIIDSYWIITQLLNDVNSLKEKKIKNVNECKHFATIYYQP
nr:MAG TPA: crossover junction endodeoxyribonuclease [Caudoviricetes sp.]